MSDTQPHRIEVEISGGRRQGLLNGDITFKGVCDAEEGAPCRMWCNQPDCREEAQDGHENHPLVDQGECGVISSLNADPSFIPEAYDGPQAPLRSDFIELNQDIDGVSWHYAEEPLTDLERLVELGRGLSEYHGSLVALHEELVDQSNSLAGYHSNLREYGDCLREYKGSLLAYKDDLDKLSERRGGPPASEPGETEELTPDAAATPSRPACAENCRHQCPECQHGLGSHLTCDPRCDHHQPAPSP
ncbi:hypothetical protein [Arthrobacter sp. ES1]|uniref:hypothetical protein n=1 Tax=Arthrobacter sp. ES1 TaxID=1897056 RepID=UPI001CFF5ABF|nr:hypothetical protein [Arthrobacter sp. ES1]MCB5280563.1 hypothetical protein [Arthrobacter sp. ES1]